MPFHAPDFLRARDGAMATTRETHGNNGLFILRTPRGALRIIAAEGMGWEHVSVSTRERAPTWDEMCAVKALFWSPEDTVVQYHPPESQYVNVHPHCLHLWRPIGVELPAPPMCMV